jgi:hypothetical protein
MPASAAAFARGSRGTDIAFVRSARRALPREGMSRSKRSLSIEGSSCAAARGFRLALAQGKRS